MTVHDALTRPEPVKLTVADYVLLSEAGALASYPKTELIDGVVVAVNARYSEHYVVKSLLYRRVADACDALGRGVEAWTEGSVAIPPHNVPEPDIFLTDRRPRAGLTDASTVLLVVEVAATTLDTDLGRKQALYARARIGEYWVVDVDKRLIHQMWAPAGERYAERRKRVFGEAVLAATIEGLKVETGSL